MSPSGIHVPLFQTKFVRCELAQDVYSGLFRYTICLTIHYVRAYICHHVTQNEMEFGINLTFTHIAYGQHVMYRKYRTRLNDTRKFF